MLQLFKIEKKTLVWSSLVLHGLATNETHIQSGKKSFVLNHEEEEWDTDHDLKKQLFSIFGKLSRPLQREQLIMLGNKSMSL